MKKSRRLLIIVSVLCLLFLFTACSNDDSASEENNSVQESSNNVNEEVKESSGEVITLRYADSQPDGYPSVVAAEEFAKIISEKTDGKIEIKIYPGGQLGDEKSNIEQLQFGALDFARVSIGPLSEFSPSLNVLQLPYLFRDADHMWAVSDGEIGQQMLDSLEDVNIIGLCWYDAGSRNFYNSVKEIHTLEDLKDLKIRVMESELMIDMAKALGVNPTPMNSGEVYSSLQSGIIQGAENNIPTYVANAHNEVARYFTHDEHIRIPEPLLVSKKVMDELTEEEQQIIIDAAKEASKIQRELWKEYEAESIKKAEEKGTIFTELSEEEKMKFQEACKPLYSKYAEGYEELVESILNVE